MMRSDSDSEEFKFLIDGPKTVQKTLNQWKHQYNLELLPIGVGHNSLGEINSVALLVLRQERDKRE